jgi:hypothetical protein
MAGTVYPIRLSRRKGNLQEVAGGAGSNGTRFRLSVTLRSLLWGGPEMSAMLAEPTSDQDRSRSTGIDRSGITKLARARSLHNVSSR